MKKNTVPAIIVFSSDLEKYSRPKEEKEIYQQKLNALKSWFGKMKQESPHNVKESVHTSEKEAHCVGQRTHTHVEREAHA